MTRPLRRGRGGTIPGLPSIPTIPSLVSIIVSMAHPNVFAVADSPQAWKDIARWQSNGTSGAGGDQTTLQNALNEVAAELAGGANVAAGGLVIGAPGTYYFASPGVTVPAGCGFLGTGRRSTMIRGVGTWSQAGEAAYFTINDNGAAVFDQCELGGFSINGWATDHHGIYINRTGGTGSFIANNPDPGDYIHDIAIIGVDGCGLKMNGSRNREAFVQNLRIQGTGNIANRPGVYIAGGSDYQFVNVSVGSAGVSPPSTNNGCHGFDIYGSDGVFSNCRSWLNSGNGFHVHANGNSFSACSGHDNADHGFFIAADRCSIAGSRAYNNGISGLATSAGFFFGETTTPVTTTAKNVSLAGCSSYDMITSDHASKTQDYGYYVDTMCTHIQVFGTAGESATTRNVTDDWGAPGSTATFQVRVTGISGLTAIN